MISDHLRQWLTESWKVEAAAAARYTTKTGPLSPSNWQKVVELVQVAFWEGRLVEETTWQLVFLITNDGGDYCIIGMV